jgi:hypothetical protein
MKRSKFYLLGTTCILALAAFANKAHFFGHTKIGFFDATGLAGCIYTASHAAATLNSKTANSPVYQTNPTNLSGPYTVYSVKRAAGVACSGQLLYQNKISGE